MGVNRLWASPGVWGELTLTCGGSESIHPIHSMIRRHATLRHNELLNILPKNYNFHALNGFVPDTVRGFYNWYRPVSPIGVIKSLSPK